MKRILAPATDLDRSAETAPATVQELYRTAAPIPDLKPGGYAISFAPQNVADREMVLGYLREIGLEEVRLVDVSWAKARLAVGRCST